MVEKSFFFGAFFLLFTLWDSLYSSSEGESVEAIPRRAIIIAGVLS